VRNSPKAWLQRSESSGRKGSRDSSKSALRQEQSFKARLLDPNSGRSATETGSKLCPPTVARREDRRTTKVGKRGLLHADIGRMDSWAIQDECELLRLGVKARASMCCVGAMLAGGRNNAEFGNFHRVRPSRSMGSEALDEPHSSNSFLPPNSADISRFRCVWRITHCGLHCRRTRLCGVPRGN
jgi:hypothetical protein